MAPIVLFVSGPRRAGKSTVIQQIIRACELSSPHYLRLTSARGDKRQPAAAVTPQDECGVASAQWIEYDEDRVFEILPAVLGKIHVDDREALVIIEADADPTLRSAYPYDYRVFVMPAPRRTTEVFRTRTQATEAFHAALNDTAVFAREIYGLADDGDRFDDGASEKRSALTATQLRGLMNSPLGDELATRILLQPTHHGLLESDIVVVNTAVGGTSEVVDQCVRRLERVLDHVRPPAGQRSPLYSCDPADPHDPLRTKLLERIAELLDPKRAPSETNGPASPRRKVARWR